MKLIGAGIARVKATPKNLKYSDALYNRRKQGTFERSFIMKNFEIILTKKYRFVVTAESIEEATAWAQTHDFEDVEAETSAYDVDFSEEVYSSNDDAAFEI